MDDGQDVDMDGLDLVKDTVRVQRQLPDVLLVEFRHHVPHAGQLFEQEGLAHQGIRHALGIERRILGDVV